MPRGGAPAALPYLRLEDHHEIYTIREPRLEGKTFGEVQQAYDSAAVFGVMDAEGAAVLNPPTDRPLAKGEKLVLLAEDDSAIRLDGKDHPVAEDLVVARPTPRPDAERTLVLDWNDGGRVILLELDQFVVDGSSVVVVVPTEERAEEVRAVSEELKRQDLEVRVAEPSSWETLEGMELAEFDHVILLSSDSMSPADADARVLVSLIHVRHRMEAVEADQSVVSELVMEENRAIALTDRADDFVVGNHLVSLIYSQLAENPDVAAILGSLLSDEGAEIYLKPVADYVKLGEDVDFYTVLAAAQRKGEAAIGYRLLAEHADTDANYGVHLNPRKAEKVKFSVGDRVIVIAEDYFE
jgi:voltage-gated potassium channel Kch